MYCGRAVILIATSVNCSEVNLMWLMPCLHFLPFVHCVHCCIMQESVPRVQEEQSMQEICNKSHEEGGHDK